MAGINSKPWLTLIGLICISFLFSACAILGGRIQKDPFNFKTSGLSQYPLQDAQTLFDKIRAKNQEIKTIKGIGTLRVENKDESFTSRLAWIGRDDGNMRIEVMGPYGQPVASLAANGKTVFFNLHVEKKFYEKDLTKNSLKTYLNIPITVIQMVDFLSGRIPIDCYDEIALSENSTGDGLVLHIFNKEEKQVIKLFMDKKKESVYKVDFFRSLNKLAFRAEFFKQKIVDTYKIPFQINIVDGKGSHFSLEMDRVWANTDIDESVFKLTPPN